MRPRLAILAAAVLAAALSAAPASAGDLSRADRSTLQRYAADTWHSFDLLVDAQSGLPDDNVSADGAAATRRRRTSAPTCGARWARARSGSSAGARRPRD